MYRHHDEDQDDGDMESQPLLSGTAGTPARAPAATSSGNQGSDSSPSCLQSMREAGRKLKLEVLALYLALQDPQCGWKARTMVVVVLIYALSPLDWIPELIPALALVVDFIILPLLIWLTVKLMPPEVLERARGRAASHELTVSGDWKLVAMVYILWLLNVVVLIRIIAKHTSKEAYIHTHQLKLMALGALVVTLLFVLLTWWRLHVESNQDKLHGLQGALEPQEPLLPARSDESVQFTGRDPAGAPGPHPVW